MVPDIAGDLLYLRKRASASASEIVAFVWLPCIVDRLLKVISNLYSTQSYTHLRRWGCIWRRSTTPDLPPISCGRIQCFIPSAAKPDGTIR